MLGGVLNFMKPTKKEEAATAKEGIFLDDLDPRELDPEVAALYFPKFRYSLHLVSFPTSVVTICLRLEEK